MSKSSSAWSTSDSLGSRLEERFLEVSRSTRRGASRANIGPGIRNDRRSTDKIKGTRIRAGVETLSHGSGWILVGVISDELEDVPPPNRLCRPVMAGTPEVRMLLLARNICLEIVASPRSPKL